MKKTEIGMNRTVYLGFSILDISKIVMCKFWDNYTYKNTMIDKVMKLKDLYYKKKNIKGKKAGIMKDK